jgi:hypothetical protein
VLAKEPAGVPLAAGCLLQPADLGAPLIGAVRRLKPVDHGADAGLAQGRQVGRDLVCGPAVQVGITGGVANVEPGFGALRDLVDGLVRGADAGEADRGPPRLLRRHRIGRQYPLYAALKLEQRVVAQPRIGRVGGAALRLQPYPEDSLGLGDDVQPAGLAHHGEPAGHPLLQLVQRAIVPARLLVGDELQPERVRQLGRELTERESLDQRRDLHVLRAASEQAAIVQARQELMRLGRHDIQVRVQDDGELWPLGGHVDQRARPAAGLEPLDGKARPHEIEYEAQRSPQLLGPLTGRFHGQQPGCRRQERV